MQDNNIRPHQLRAWLSQDDNGYDQDAGEQAITELFGIIKGAPVDETINSIKAFLDNHKGEL